MVVEEIITAFPQLENSINSLVNILQIIGGIIGVYIVLWIIAAIINARRLRLLKTLLEELGETNKKLDTLIRNSKRN